MNSEIATKLTSTAAFHCSTEWHLARLGKYAVAIHSLMLHVQGEDHFYGSLEHIAEYFSADDRSIRRPLQKMVKLGFVQEITTRRGSSTVYRAVRHKEWANRHPGQCVAKREFGANPSQKMGEVTNSTGGATNSPADMHYPSPQMGVHPSQKMGGKSPIESPIKRDDSSVTSTDERAIPFRKTQLSAAQQAYKQFQADENLNMFEKSDAFSMLLWCLYRAVNSMKEIPSTVSFYTKVRDNFLADHLGVGYVSILDEAADRFDRHARDFLADRNPELLAWVLEERRNLEAEPVPVGTDDDIWP